MGISEEEATARMVGIGMVFGGRPADQPQIENVLLMASELGMAGDYRVLDVLVNWLSVHIRCVHTDRLFRAIKVHDDDRVKAFWTAVGQWHDKDARFSRFRKLYCEARIDVGTSPAMTFQIDRHGEDERFAQTCLRVPGNLLRKEPVDVMIPERLLKRHHGYYNRVCMGANWRADAWTELEAQPHLTAAQLRRELGCAYATAYDAKQDFEKVRRAQGDAA